MTRRAFLVASGMPFVRKRQQTSDTELLPWDPQDPPVTPFRARPQWAASGLAEVTTDGAVVYAELAYRTEDRRTERFTLVARAGSELALFLNPLGSRVEMVLGIVITKS